MEQKLSLPPPDPNSLVSEAGLTISNDGSSKTDRVARKFMIAALGAVPWVGSLLSAAAEIDDDEKNHKYRELHQQWLLEHKSKLQQLSETIQAVIRRFESFGSEVEERIQSPQYLSLVRQAFKAWDAAETTEKREFVANLIANCAGTRVCSDDVVRLFLSWLNAFHEAHFAVIREIHQNPGSTRFDIWSGIYGDIPREDSAEADLYRMLISDLTMARVIRQPRDTTESGQFIRKRPAKRRGPVSGILESSFDDTKQYVLTGLGKQFVHYTLLGDIRRME